ncbi:SOS response-associated peptidase [Chryseobacterium sp. R2A-55]|uniref:SOS response-associated peptidase n=1 Tax=Chryseobacterium sp. R2A-55 TaxID=2744445 RepID=UPI001F3B47A9|nr:SOS response-associated peptidase family protein [Chryseobacterium sp. R2A-55]
MCNYISLLSEAQELEEYFEAQYVGEPYHREFRINGFATPRVPIIVDRDTSHIVPAEWGLIAFWSKNRDFQKKTLNARIETAEELKSYKNSVNNRCLILVNGFHEWQWQDEKGKIKHQYLVGIKDQPIFALGGIYNLWTDPETQKEVPTVTVVTTQANELMSEIHNTKHRMPIMLGKQVQYRWLDDIPLQDFSFPNYEAEVVATNLSFENKLF